MIEYTRKIFGFECDIYGHLNNAAYLNLYEEARSDVLDKLGYPIHELLKDGLFIYVTQIDIRFLKEVSLGSIVTVSTRAVESTRVRFTWEQDIRNSDGIVCNTARVVAAFVRDGRPWRIPPGMYEDLKSLDV